MMAGRTTIDQFHAVYPRLTKEILSHASRYQLGEVEKAWLATNPLGSECNRGLAVADVVSILLGRPLDENEFFRASALGWMVELLRACFLVANDIIDDKVTRRGRSSWHSKNGIGLIAINDACILEAGIYVLLKRYFRGHPSYVPMLELIHETTFQTEMGQLCDLTCAAAKNKGSIESFSIERYNFLVVHKTAYHSFYLPVALALHQLALGTDANLQVAKEIAMLLGEYVQIQDDYLDCYGDFKEVTREDSDIRDGKCTWLILQALEKATPAQKLALKKSYGKQGSEKVVRDIYDQLGLDAAYKELKKCMSRNIRSKVDGIDETGGVRKEVFTQFLDKISRPAR
ncbi:farnesyl pyrophosphate synthetase [Fusarium longipes]|uniref:Farnesyl pyrophosphate synthetase n=1 Tax=Fusarium longipes TaxID=694270 RepID=A0A395RIE6_9HYPO|nr:farnesyl pyrophosphate synthetase [Fusarium longipes]